MPRATSIAPDLQAAVDDVLAKGLAKQPADRYPSARTFVDALGDALSAPPPARRPRRFASVAATVGAAVGTAVAVAVAAVVLAPTQSIAGAASTAVSTAAIGAPPQNLADVPRGDLLYEAAMNGTPKGFVQSPATEADSAREAIRYVPGALEIEAYTAGADTYSELDLTDGVLTYIGEMDLTVRPGSDLDLCWSLRWAKPKELANYLCVHTATATAELSVFRRGHGRTPLGPQVPLPGLASGGPVHLAVVVRDRTLALYVDGTLGAAVANDDVPVAHTVPGIEMEQAKGPGLVRIEGLRLYGLTT